MTFVILAAGRGSRMGKLTADTPKCLMPLAGSTLLDWQLDAAQRCGLSERLVVRGYKGSLIERADLDCLDNPAWASTNMVATLWCAEARFGEDLIVAYGDIAYEARVLRALLDSPADISIVVDTGWLGYWQRRFQNPLDDAESLSLDATGRITSIGQPLRRLEDADAQYVGLMRFKGLGLTALKEVQAAGAHSAATGGHPFGLSTRFENLYMTDLLQAMIEAGHDLMAVPVDRGWVELDSEDDYDLAKSLASATAGGLSLDS